MTFGGVPLFPLARGPWWALLLAVLLALPVSGALAGSPLSGTVHPPLRVSQVQAGRSSLLVASPHSTHPVAAYDPGGLPWPLRGVDRSGTEYACIQGWGYGDGPYNLTSVEAIRSWNVTAVRVPLNEDCWLDINVNGTSAAAWSGAGYRAFVESYVDLLESQGIRPVLDLHWNAPGTNQSVGQEPMADEDHAPAFWASVATAFRNDSLVIFDLYNEPHDISWDCWLNGCFQTDTSPGWRTAGMQQLLEEVRDAGATTQLVILGGLNWSNDPSGFLSHTPVDPAGPGRLGVDLHMYDGNPCGDWGCWNSTLLPIVRSGFPLVTDELGESDCNATFIDRYFAWADPLDVSYLGWTWDAWNSCDGPTLIADYTGTPYMAYGAGFRAHLLGFSVPAASAPSAPRDLLAAASNRSVALTWEGPATNGTWPVESYNVSWGSSPAHLSSYQVVMAPDPLALPVRGLTDGTPYDFEVRAWTPVGAGPPSAEVSATPEENLSAALSASPTSGPAPLTVAYHAGTRGGTPPYSIAWDFEDGSNGAGSWTNHTFEAAGTYTAVAEVCALHGDCLNASAPSVDVEGASTPLSVLPNASVRSCVSPCAVSFGGSAGGGVAPYSYSWTFGDGSRASGLALEHTYIDPIATNFTATLWANDSSGRSGNATVVVDVRPPLEVSVAASPASGVAPLTVRFWANATGGQGAFGYLWSFGDGGDSFVADPEHTFEGPGSYRVVLTVSDGMGDQVGGPVVVAVRCATSCPSSTGGGSSGASGGPLGVGWTTLAVGAGVVVIAAVAVLALVRVRSDRRRPPTGPDLPGAVPIQGPPPSPE